MLNVEIKKKDSETTGSILRRFTKKVQSSGVLNRVRSIRYSARPINFTRRKKRKLTVLTRVADKEKLIKLGKAPLPRERRF